MGADKYECKNYEKWLKEDAKGPIRTIFVVSVLVGLLSALGGAVIFILLTTAAKGQPVGRTSFSPMEWALVACILVAVISFGIHKLMEYVLSKEYENYVFETLYAKSMLF